MFQNVLILILVFFAPTSVLAQQSEKAGLLELETEFEVAARGPAIAEFLSDGDSIVASIISNNALSTSFRYFHMKDVFARSADLCANVTEFSVWERCFENEADAPRHPNPLFVPPPSFYGLLSKMESRVAQAKTDSENICGLGGLSACLARLSVRLECHASKSERISRIQKFLKDLPAESSFEQVALLRTAMFKESDLCDSPDEESIFSDIKIPTVIPRHSPSSLAIDSCVNPVSDFDRFLSEPGEWAPQLGAQLEAFAKNNGPILSCVIDIIQIYAQMALKLPE